MLNCPATNNTCPSRKLSGLSDRLFLEKCRDMDGLPIDPDVYREALEALRAVLLDGCHNCVKAAVIYLAIDMKWPPHRGLQIVLVEDLLRRTAPTVH